MKILPLILTLSFLALPVFAAQKAGPDWTAGKGISEQCGNAVMKKIQADKEVASYLEDGMTVSLEWYDNEKTQIDFNFNFGEDVRDGYMTGQVMATPLKGGNCKVGRVVNTSVGD